MISRPACPLLTVVIPGKPAPPNLQRFPIRRNARQPQADLFDQLDQDEPKLLDLHRHEDGYVSFASKNDDYFKPKFAARPSDYQDQGKIPPASIIVRSGRGMWVIWLLRDPKTPDRAQPAFPEKIDLYLTGFLAANVKHSVLQFSKWAIQNAPRRV